MGLRVIFESDQESGGRSLLGARMGETIGNEAGRPWEGEIRD